MQQDNALKILAWLEEQFDNGRSFTMRKKGVSMWQRLTGTEKGFTLFELAVVLAGLAIIATTAIPFFVRRAEISAAQKTAKEVSTIQEAAKWHYISTKAWPLSIQALKDGGFLNPAWSAINPWGSSYSISSIGASFTVTTTIPNSAAGVLLRALPGVSS